METKEKGFKQSEKEERFGRSVTIHARFVRHGEKDGEGRLTPEGHRQGRGFGEDIEPSDAIKAYVSTVERVAETAGNIVEASSHEKKLNQRSRQELSIPPMSSEAIKKFQEMEKESPGSGMDWYLSFDSERPDSETASPREVAQGIAYLIKRYINMADRLKSGSEIDLINGTHQSITETFLSYSLVWEKDGEKKTGFESMSEVGGALDFAEEIEFRIATDEKGAKKIKVYFRGNEHDIDTSVLEELAEEYKQGKYKK